MEQQTLQSGIEDKKQLKKVHRQVFLIFLAFEIVLANSAIGYIDIHPISLTLMNIPVIFGALYLGKSAGAILGAVFGLASMWKASTAIAYGDKVFSPFLSGKPLESIILSIITRLLFGLVAAILFDIFRKRGKLNRIAIGFISTISFGIHSILVCACLGLFFPEAIKGENSFIDVKFGLAVSLTYVVPSIIIVLVDYVIMSKRVQELLVSGRRLIIFRKSHVKKKKVTIILSSVLIAFTLLLLAHIYGRIKLVLQSQDISLTQEILSGVFQIQLQLLTAMLALFYIIYIVMMLIFEFSEVRKAENLELNRALKENEEYRKAIEKALEEAKSASEAKTQFISRMSHDIRTPLNAIIGLSAIGIDDSMDDSKESESFHKIWTSGNYLLGLVNDILDLSKIESDSVELHPEPFSVTNCIDDIYIILREQMEEKQLKFSYRSNGMQNTTLLVDPMRFQQIFMNLISNSVKYTNMGGRIEVDTMLTPSSEGMAKLVTKIRDTGIGMSPEFIQIMYEPYSQGDIKNQSKGSGLGLAIVKNLIERMNGTIQVKSKLNEGTEFTVAMEFPISTQIVKAPSIHKFEESSLMGKRVLLVEDNQINIEVSRVLLQKKGVLVEVAENGKEAIDCFLAHEEDYYDVILMDIFMPIMDGIKATKEIRTMERADAKTVPIIAMTANALQEDMSDALEAGMDAYLTKPIIPNKMYQVLAEWMKHTR